VAIGSKESTEVILQNLNFAIPVTDFPSLASFRPAPRVTVPFAVTSPAPFWAEGHFYPTQTPSVGPTPTAMPTLNSIPNLNDAEWPDGRKLLHPDRSVRTRVVNVKINDTLKLRSGPGTSFRAVAEIPAGETNITAFNYDQVWDGDSWWCPVEWRGLRGYVGRSHLPKP
jgi:hypothetical protein